MLPSNFSEIVKQFLKKYGMFLEKQNFENRINKISIIDQNKETFIFGYEVGFLVAELENLFVKTYNRMMEQPERLEINELVENYVVPRLKRTILGV